jgi:RHS repeat-associated protein
MSHSQHGHGSPLSAETIAHGRGSKRRLFGWRSLQRAASAIASAASNAAAGLSFEATSGVIVEQLEERRMFDYNHLCTGHPYPFFPIKVGGASAGHCPPGSDNPVRESSDASGLGPGTVTPPLTTYAPVSYFDGQPVLDKRDLISSGFGMPWGQTRSFGDAVGEDGAGLQPSGNHWTVMQQPYLVSQPRFLATSDGTGGGAGSGADSGGSGGTSDTVIAVMGGGGGLTFNNGTGSQWIHSQLDTNSYRSGASSATITDTRGDQIYFEDLGTYLVFKSYTDPGGNVTTVTSRSGGFPVNIERVNGSTTERWHYDYLSSGSNQGRLQDVLLQRNIGGGANFTTIRQAVYDYYTDANTQPGSLNDLKSVTIEDGSGNVIDKTVYRYYTTNGASAFAGGVKYVFNEDGYKRSMAAGFDPTSASDADVAPFADNYFEYDADHRVTLETAQGTGCSCSGSDGLGTYHLSYATNPDTTAAQGVNNWTNKTTETLPDGSYNYVFMNAVGQTLLKIHTGSDGSGQQGWFYNYDNNSRLTLYATSSALILPPNAESVFTGYNDLLHNIGTGGTTDYQYLSNHSGLVETFDYYASTTATSTTAGGADGYYHETYLLQGEMGTPIKQDAVDYKSRAGTNSTVYYRASDTVYSDTGGSVARTTQYSYTYSGAATLLPQTITTTFPTISTTHNGQGTSVAVTQVVTYDKYGRDIQTVDGDNYTTKTTYDDATGSITKYEQDAGTGGLDLTTNYTVDGLGRTTKITDPKGNITYYTYDDVAHESRSYPGWHSYTSGTNTLYTTTGPVGISKKYQPINSGEALFNETLTATIAGQSASIPTGHEAIGSITSLHREITNNSGQVVEARDYFNLTGTSYAAVTLGTASNDSTTGNYHATTYHYNEQGLLDGVRDAAGTIARLVYDSSYRLTSKWIGTDDGSTNTADFNPASPGNMVDVTEYTYDLSRRPFTAPSAPTLSQAAGTMTATTYYVEVTYVNSHGESLASMENPYAVTGSTGQLVVAHPTAVTGATGYNVYVSTDSGKEQKQNGDTPVSISSDWTEPSTGLVGGDAAPVQENFGNGNLSEVTQHPQPGTPSADRVTDNYFDWRNRLVETKSGVQTSEDSTTHRPIYYLSYDNLDELTQIAKYDGDQQAITSTGGVPDAPSGNLLRAKEAISYDEWGQVYRTDTYDIIQSGVNAGNTFTSNTLSTQTWRDHRGNVIASVRPGGLVSKYVYDGAGRLIKQYVSDGGVMANPSTWNTYANAASVTNDIVLRQVELRYDLNGNVILATQRDRFHNDATNNATVTGLGDLQNPTNNPKARVTYQSFYYDAIDRQTDSAFWGTLGGNGTSGISLTTAPARSGTVMVSSNSFNSSGWIDTTTDPKGLLSKTYYDLMGRPTRTVSAFVDPGTNTLQTFSDHNQITDYTYDGSSHVLTQKAWVNNNGTNNVFQTTQYVYGITTGGGSGLNSNDILQQVQYPNTSTGNPGTTSAFIEGYAYDALGELTKKTQRTGSVHQYSYDQLGRMTSDNVITLGTGVNNTIRRLDYSFDTGGRLYTATSYAGTTTATIVNQVMRLYNGLGQITQEYQSHTGAVVTSGTSATPSVQYTYNDMSGGANNSRLTGIVYPTGSRTVTYAYNGNSGLDNVICRLSALTQTLGAGTNAATTTLETYDYLGTSTIVRVGHPQTGIDLTYEQQTGDTHAITDGGDMYTGLDRFGRFSDQNYLNTNTGTNLTSTDRFQYGYDANSNDLYKNNLASSANSELYHANGTNGGYDSLNRLTDFKRGTLSSNNTTVTSASATRTWSLDAQGNWSANAAGSAYTVNNENQYTSVVGTYCSSSSCCCCCSCGPTTLSFSYDNDGNLASRPAPSGSGATANDVFTYDAWDREVQMTRYLSSGYVYDVASNIDALGRKTQMVASSSIYFGSNPPLPSDDLYYSTSWQVLEDDNTQVQYGTGGGVVSSTYTQMQFVWSPTYVNDLVLRDRSTAGNGAFNERIYVQHDANHNVTAITNTGGTVQERFVYDPYGTATVLSSTWGTATDTLNWQYMFQGGRYDSTSGLYAFQRREYDPALGRWIEQEPRGAAFIAGTNLYEFGAGSPPGRVDPSGFEPWPSSFMGHTPADFQGYGPPQQNPYHPDFSVKIPEIGNITNTDELTKYLNEENTRAAYWAHQQDENMAGWDRSVAKKISDRLDTLLDPNNKLGEIIKQSGGKYGYPNTGPSISAPGTSPRPPDCEVYPIVRRPGQKAKDIAMSLLGGKASPGVPELSEVGDNTGYGGMEKRRPGTSRERVDPKNENASSRAEAAVAGVQAAAALTNELLNSLNNANVIFWKQGNQEGWYVEGQPDDVGQRIIRTWVGEP